jgi:histidine ammonia-lyase
LDKSRPAGTIIVVTGEPPAEVLVGGATLTVGDVVAVARHGAPVALAPSSLETMASSRRVVEALARQTTPVYGISTGFGGLATRYIEPPLRSLLQENIVRSHAAGVGDPVDAEVVRAMTCLRLRTLVSGGTGARPVVATTIAARLNAGITPVVPTHGSLGCSGDLVPRAHCDLALLGEGR